MQSMEASIAKQKAAVQAQVADAPRNGFFVTGWLSPAPVLALAVDCEPATSMETEAAIKDAADAQHLNPALISAVVRQESGFEPCAVSGKGAMGLMQLMPDTAAQFNVADPFNARENVAAGSKYLKQLLGRYKGDLRLALSAYNAGPKKVDGDPPAEPDIAETKDYVNRILKAMNGAPPETGDAGKQP
jgi:soluble lytic murein transglycosylase-like protein